MTPILCRCTCHLVYVRMYVYVILCVFVCMYMYSFVCICMYYIFEFVYTQVHTYMNLNINILSLQMNVSNVMMVNLSSRVCAYVCVCHLVCAHMFTYGCMCNTSEFVYAWVHTHVNLNIHILSLLTNDSNFIKVYIPSSVCMCIFVCFT